MVVKRKQLVLVVVIVTLVVAGCGAQRTGSDTAGAEPTRGVDQGH